MNYQYRCGNNYKIPTNNFTYPVNYNKEEDRFFLAPFVVGGLAGTALGYGIANNNQMKGGYYMPPVYYYPPQVMPYTYNNYYY